ncbi:hypothetical protein JA1_003499 [Spathaspora sp. JA1]|nr:hypothetical protein JA1_003499 [Spathaspora sp. JA1]
MIHTANANSQQADNAGHAFALPMPFPFDSLPSDIPEVRYSTLDDGSFPEVGDEPGPFVDLKPDQLLIIPPMVVGDHIEDVSENQQRSLQRLCLSNHGRKERYVPRFGMKAFDRIVKLERALFGDSEQMGTFKVTYTSENLVDDLQKIRNMIEGGSRLQLLYQVVLNDRCYFIKRYSKENIYVIPCNTLMSANQNKFFEYNFSTE